MRDKPPRFAGGFTAKAVTLNEKQNIAKLMLTCLSVVHLVKVVAEFKQEKMIALF